MPSTRRILSLFTLLLSAAVLVTSQNVSYYYASPSFASILGPDPNVIVLAESDLPLFHEGAVYNPPTQSLFVTSDTIEDNSTAEGLVSYISVVTGDLSSPSSVEVQTLDNSVHNIPFALGGYRYLSATNLIVWAAQGSLSQPGGLYFFNPEPPYNATPLVTSFGQFEFNSPNDVAVTPAGEIYFSDPIYGWVYGFRPQAQLPNQFYRYNPATGIVRTVADGFIRSNGVGINKDGSVAYFIDSGAQPDNGAPDLQGPRTIYAFDVQRAEGSDETVGGFLGNRRLSAFPDVGGYKGVKTDTNGNVYAGVDDGVTVWNAGGDLLGKILVEGGIANLGFGEAGVLFGLGDTRLYRIELSSDVIGSSTLI